MDDKPIRIKTYGPGVRIGGLLGRWVPSFVVAEDLPPITDEEVRQVGSGVLVGFRIDETGERHPIRARDFYRD